MTCRKLLLTILLLSLFSLTYAQVREKCATVPYNRSKLSRIGFSEKDFEKWVQNRIKVRRSQQASSRTQEETYIIPVVIHVIHNGEALGTAANIPASQIQEQMRILNEDFRRKNLDSVKTPAAFRPAAGDMLIEFKLAVQDPDGAPTSGIVRVNGRKSGWRYEDGDNLKEISYWPSDKYLNIWVANMTDNTIGFSQFPTSSILDGLEEGSDIAETDGVVIAYKEFGMGGNANRRSRGRTLTHEIGHFLGLKHVWGDDDNQCSGEDYVSDTPNQAGQHNTCPGYPSASCGNTSDMFMNYMDYTPDTCMNLFTKGQRERMRVILENSPRRISLLNSPALSAPQSYSRDVAVTKILSPGSSACDNIINPSFILRNLGTTTLTTVVIDYKINDVSNTITKTVNVASLDTTRIDLPQLTLSSNSGNYLLTIELKSPNGGTDERLTNNIGTQNFYIAPLVDLPFEEKFNDLSNFSVINTTNAAEWVIKNAPGNGSNNKAISISYLNTSQYGLLNYLISPTFSTFDIDSLSLSFKYAYAARDDFSEDELLIRLSLDCGENFLEQDEIFYSNGAFMQTVDPRPTAFTPGSIDHWKTECLNLANYIGYGNVQIQFLSVSGGGNALYLDDITLNYSTCNGSSPVGNPPVGIDDEVLEVKFNVYPNPSEGRPYLDLDLPERQDFELVVIDALGRIVFKEKFINQKSLHQYIELGSIAPGLYFIKLDGKTINLDKKIIIKGR